MNTNASSLSRSRWFFALFTVPLLIGLSWPAHGQQLDSPEQPPVVTLVPLGRNAQGAMEVRITGPSPRVYALEASVDLTNWVRLATNVMTTSSLTFVDSQSTNIARRFYRAAITADPPYMPSQLLVQFKATTSTFAQSNILQRHGLRVQESLQTTVMAQDGAPSVLLVTATSDTKEVVAALNREPEIEFAEPNYIYELQAKPNDPRFVDGSLWGMYGDASSPANAFGSQAAEVWAQGHSGSRQVYVGVIDTGIQFNHPDLAANMWLNPFDPLNFGDNDGNGYVDDVHGWDFFNNDNSVFDGSSGNPSLDAHGTHVAGTIGALGDNGVGVVGVNWKVTIIPSKFIALLPGATLPSGSVSDAIKAVDYFTQLKRQQSLNIVALNNSWGGRGYSRALHEAIIRSADVGILFVCAAGNWVPWDTELDNDRVPFYPSSYDTSQGTPSTMPATYDSVISVAAIDKTGGSASFSHYGAKSVDLGAPGVDILSTVPWLTYASASGTSMAAPHVTGAAALLASIYPSATAEQIRQALLVAAIPTPSLAGKTATGGRLNISGGATQIVPTCPGPTLYVNGSYTGSSPNGTASRPFPRVAQALLTTTACPAVTTLSVQAGVYPESNLLFNRPVLIVASGGAAQIGAP